MTIDAELVNRLRLAIGRLNRRLRLRTNDLPPLQFSTLATLDTHGPMRSGELAQREAVTPPTMTRVIAALAERGYIERATDPADARSVRVSISPEGVAAIGRIRSERTVLLGAQLARLRPDQLAALVGALSALEALATDD